jgi:phenylalanyl-tRNA synthetase beta chain
VFPVEVEAPADCPRYAGRVIRDVNAAAPTPMWLQERLRRSGLRSISALVDITNYVMLELGQPMHAFDLERLSARIVVRRAGAGEQLELLDGTTATLDADTLVIADDEGPVALAGVMGGTATAVQDGTRHVFLESAFFAPAVVAGRARRYGKHTDSSHRFERGVDPDLQRRALERATALVLAVVGGEPGPVIEAAAPEHLPRRPPIHLRAARIQRVLGLEVPGDEVEDILRRLGMEVLAEPGGWRVKPPGFRFDVAIEEDLIEELARIAGYDRIPTTLPAGALAPAAAPEGSLGLDAVRGLLVARGYQEAITYSFVDPRLQERVEPGRTAIALENPLSSELSVMRTSLWPGLLAALQHNRNRQQARVRLFEAGLRFSRAEDGGMAQEPMLAGLVAGTRMPEQWGAPAAPVDFFDLKGDLEALLRLLGLHDAARFEPARHPALHPGQCAELRWAGEGWGLLGALHPALAGALDLDGPVLLFELRQALLARARVPAFAPLSRYPAIRRDVAVVLDESVTAQTVSDVIGQAASDVLKDLQLFDVYRGERVDSGKKSLAVALYLQAASRTLTDSEVDAVVGDVVAALESRLGARLRG